VFATFTFATNLFAKPVSEARIALMTGGILAFSGAQLAINVHTSKKASHPGPRIQDFGVEALR